MGKSGEAASATNSDKASSPVKEQPVSQAYPDWAAMQAYYGPGVAMQPYFSTTSATGHPPHPFMWGPQPLMAAFGTPYAAIYPPAVYSHPSMPPGSQAHCHMIAPFSATSESIVMATSLSTELPAKSSSNKEKSPAKKLKGIDGLAAVGDGNTENSTGDAAHKLSRRESATEVSTEGYDRKDESQGKQARTKGSSEDMPASGQDEKAEMHKGDSGVADNMGKPLSVTPQSNPTTGLDLTVCTIGNLSPVSPVAGAMGSGCDGAPDELWLQDERTLKRERRKQSNRESARRSRLRKQAETEELAMKVDTLTDENTSLRSKISRLREKSEDLRLENTALMEKLKNVKTAMVEDAICEPVDSHETKSLATENLLSRIDNSGSSISNGQWENDAPDNSNGKLRQLLDSSQRTDAVAAG